MKQVKPAQYEFDPLFGALGKECEADSITSELSAWEAQLSNLGVVDLLSSLWPGCVRVACAGDIFDDAVSDEDRTICWLQFVSKPSLVWLLSSANPEKMAAEFGRRGRVPNLWAGLKTNQESITDRQVASLVNIGAPVSFLDVTIVGRQQQPLPLRGIRWVIARNGAECADVVTGLTKIRDQCKNAGVKFFLDGPGNILEHKVERGVPKSPVSRRLYRSFAKMSERMFTELSSSAKSAAL